MSDRSGYIGRAPGDSNVVIARQIFNPTGVTTNFTFASGYDAGYLDAYLNGVRLIKGSDYTAADGSTVGFTTYTTSGDVLELVAYKAFNLGSVKEANGNFDVGNDLTVAGNLNVTGDITYDEVSGRNLDISGIATIATLGVSAATTSKDLLVTGITTLGSNNGIGTVTVGAGSTALLVQGDARVVGVLTVGSSSITLDGSNNIVNVGTGITLNATTGKIMAPEIITSGTTGAFYPPVLNTTQRDALTVTQGAMIFNTSTSKIEFYDGSSWNSVPGVTLGLGMGVF